MTFALRLVGDGLGSPSVSSAKQVSEISRNNWKGSAARDIHAQPAEFTVNPAAGSVLAMSDITIKVNLKTLLDIFGLLRSKETFNRT